MRDLFDNQMELMDQLHDQRAPLFATATQADGYAPAPPRGDRTYSDLLTLEAGQYDTAKKSNHSSARIPQDIVDQIEAGTATSDQVAALAGRFPIYRYRSCLTIHGTWPQVQRDSIGSYKNIRQNGNGSLEVLWTALDLERKERIATALKATGSPIHFSIDSSSTSYNWTKEVDAATWNTVRDRMYAIVNACKSTGAYVKGYVQRMNYYGSTFLCLTIDVRAIPIGSEAALTLALCESNSTVEIAAAIAKYNKEQQEKEEKWKREAAERKAAQEAHADAVEAEKAKVAATIAHLPQATAFAIGSTYATPTKMNTGNGWYIGLRLVRVTGKAPFGRVTWEKGLVNKLGDQPTTWKAQKACKAADIGKPNEHRIAN